MYCSLEMSLKQVTVGLVGSWFLVGLVVLAAGFGGFLYPAVSVLLIGPLLFLILAGARFLRTIRSGSIATRWLVATLGFVWLSHFMQVLTPETGFDAVWYHLPVVKAMTSAHGFVFLPDLYQSLNPLFSDGLFLLGWQVFGDGGAKLVAFGLGLTLILVCYQLARTHLTIDQSLLLVLLISTFQVVAWQSASFYVDVAKAVWDISLVWFGWQALQAKDQKDESSLWWLLGTGAMFGASLGTKLFSVLLIPVFVVAFVMVGWQQKHTLPWILSGVAIVLVVAAGVALPYSWRSYVETSQASVGVSAHLEKLEEIGGKSSLGAYILDRFVLLPWSFIKVGLVRDYVWIGLPAGLLLLFLNFKKIVKSTYLQWLGLFGLGQWLVWWFVPPLSTRYALAGFCLLVLVTGNIVFSLERKVVRRIFIILMVVSAGVQFVPRLVVNQRSLQYVLGLQTKSEYLAQFRDGWIDQHLDAWHGEVR